MHNTLSTIQFAHFIMETDPTPAGAAGLNWTGISTIIGVILSMLLIYGGLWIGSQFKEGDVAKAGTQAGHMGVGISLVVVGLVVGGATIINLFTGFVGNIITQ